MTDWSLKQYKDLNRKQLQLLCSEYPYKSDNQLFDSTLGNSFDSRKPFSSRQELMDFKEEAAQNDVALQKRRDFVVGSETTKNSQTISIIDAVLGDKGEDEYRAAVELASYEQDPLSMATGLSAIAIMMLRDGIQYDKEVGMGVSQETLAAMSNSITLTKLINEIQNGKHVDVTLGGSLSSMIMDIDLDDLQDEDLEDDNYIDVEGEVNDE